MKRPSLPFFALLLLVSPLLASCGASRAGRAQAMNDSTRQIMQLGLAARAYSFDYKGKLPPMQNSQACEAAITPYLMKRKDAFLSPATGQRYACNASLSGRVLKSAQLANDTAMFYEITPISGPNDASNLYRVVCYASGNVKALPESQWPALKKASGIR